MQTKKEKGEKREDVTAAAYSQTKMKDNHADGQETKMKWRWAKAVRGFFEKY